MHAKHESGACKGQCIYIYCGYRLFGTLRVTWELRDPTICCHNLHVSICIGNLFIPYAWPFHNDKFHLNLDKMLGRYIYMHAHT